MILTPENIRYIRPIAENLNDPARLLTYIREAETLRLVDAIGAPLYRWLDESDFSGDGPFSYYRPDGTDISISKYEYEIMMNGGYYESKCECDPGRTEGLITAIAYISYARFIVNNPVNATAFGVVHKNGEFSTNVNDNILIRTSNEARKIGEAYLQNVIDNLKAYGLIGCRKYIESPRRIIRISKRKI